MTTLIHGFMIYIILYPSPNCRDLAKVPSNTAKGPANPWSRFWTIWWTQVLAGLYRLVAMFTNGLSQGFTWSQVFRLWLCKNQQDNRSTGSVLTTAAKISVAVVGLAIQLQALLARTPCTFATGMSEDVKVAVASSSGFARADISSHPVKANRTEFKASASSCWPLLPLVFLNRWRKADWKSPWHPNPNLRKALYIHRHAAHTCGLLESTITITRRSSTVCLSQSRSHGCELWFKTKTTTKNKSSKSTGR